MKFIGIIPHDPVRIEYLFEQFRVRDDDVVELNMRGKKLRFSFCSYKKGFPLEKFLQEAEKKRREMKGSGIICIAGASDMEKLISSALDMGYRIYMFDLDGDFFYGRGIFPVIRVGDPGHLVRMMEEIL